MALNTNLPMGYRPPELQNPLQALMQMAQFENAQQQNALQRLQMQRGMQQQEQAAQQEQARQRYLASISGQAGPPAEFNALTAFGAGFKPEEIKALQPPKPPGLMNVGAGGAVFDPVTREPVFTAPFKPPEPDKTPEALRTLEAIYGKGTPEFMEAAKLLASKMTTHAPAASAISYGSPVPIQLPGGATGYAQPGNRPGAAPQVMNDAGGKPMVKPAEADNKALTEGQAKAVTFASRMLASDKTLAELSRKGVNVSIPGADVGYGVGAAVNAVSSPDRQRLDQAKRDFINAALRRESGAVIADSEFANADKQYFPQVGDSRQVIEQKARNRRIAIEGIRADVPKGKQSEVDRISTGESGPNNDPLGLRSK